MIARTHRAGGRTSARRLLLAVAVAGVGLLPAAAVATTVDPESGPRITVREEHGVYSVTARFEVRHVPSAVLAVLTDYEAIPRFMPEINTSVVLERGIGRAVVEQEAVTRLMLFSRRVHLVLEVTEEADGLRFRDRCGRSFARYAGSWRMTTERGRTVVLYDLVAQPAFDVPEFVLTRLLKRNSARMIDQLKGEIARRSR